MIYTNHYGPTYGISSNCTKKSVARACGPHNFDIKRALLWDELPPSAVDAGPPTESGPTYAQRTALNTTRFTNDGG